MCLGEKLNFFFFLNLYLDFAEKQSLKTRLQKIVKASNTL